MKWIKFLPVLVGATLSLQTAFAASEVKPIFVSGLDLPEGYVEATAANLLNQLSPSVFIIPREDLTFTAYKDSVCVNGDCDGYLQTSPSVKFTITESKLDSSVPRVLKAGKKFNLKEKPTCHRNGDSPDGEWNCKLSLVSTDKKIEALLYIGKTIGTTHFYSAGDLNSWFALFCLLPPSFRKPFAEVLACLRPSFNRTISAA